MADMIERNMSDSRLLGEGETILPKGTAAVCWNEVNGFTFCLPTYEDGMVPEPVVFLAAIMALGNKDPDFRQSIVDRFTTPEGDHYVGEAPSNRGD